MTRALSDLAGLSDSGGTTTRPFILKNAKRPLFLVVVGGFEPGNVLGQLARMPEFEDKAKVLIQQLYGAQNKGMDKKIQALMESRGYDHVVYLNSTAEGSELSRYADLGQHPIKRPTGYSPSVMVWREDQIVPLDELPGSGDKQLKKALAFIVAGAGGDDESVN